MRWVRNAQNAKAKSRKGKCKVKNHRMNAEKPIFIKIAILNFLRWQPPPPTHRSLSAYPSRVFCLFVFVFVCFCFVLFVLFFVLFCFVFFSFLFFCFFVFVLFRFVLFCFVSLKWPRRMSDRSPGWLRSLSFWYWGDREKFSRGGNTLLVRLRLNF